MSVTPLSFDGYPEHLLPCSTPPCPVNFLLFPLHDLRLQEIQESKHTELQKNFQTYEPINRQKPAKKVETIMKRPKTGQKSAKYHETAKRPIFF